MAKKAKKPGIPALSHVPTDRERQALETFKAHLTANSAPSVKVVKTGESFNLSIEHPNKQLGLLLFMQAIGSFDRDFVRGLLSQLGNASSQGGEVDQKAFNFMLAMVKGIKPKDEIEAMLAAQMAATHMATMTFAHRLAHAEKIPQQDSAERTFNKLGRTFATQMEALKRYRTGGEQKVTVHHVSVNDGGQAIVGNVTQASREPALERTADNPKALAPLETAPMPMVDQGSKEGGVAPARRKAKR
jgi:hypothetical protein